jgi:hypothetical protein
MNERKFDAGSLAEQIDSARRSLEALPEKLKEAVLFQGQNHSFDSAEAEFQSEDRVVIQQHDAE